MHVWYIFIYIYLDLPRGAEWMIRGAYTPSLRVQTAPFGRCWYIYIYTYSFTILNSSVIHVGSVNIPYQSPWKNGPIMGFVEFPMMPSTYMSHEKNPTLLSIESWMVNRDPYFMVYYNALYNWVGFHPLYNPTNQGFFSWLRFCGMFGSFAGMVMPWQGRKGNGEALDFRRESY